jgi:hypothetical protein
MNQQHLDQIRKFTTELRKDPKNRYNEHGRYMSKRECRLIVLKQTDPLAKYKPPDYSPYANSKSSQFAKNSLKEYGKFKKRYY